MSSTRRDRDELLVYGWTREYHNKIPDELMNEFIEWYHIPSYFMHASDAININEQGNIIKGKMEYAFWNNSVYGSVVMPSNSKFDIEYKYRFQIVSGTNGVCIGIDDANCKNSDRDFVGSDKTYNYAYGYNGTHYSKEIGSIGLAEPYGELFKDGDIITMYYDPSKSTLSFDHNGANQGIINNIYGDDQLKYRFCIAMTPSIDSVIELLESVYFVYNTNNMYKKEDI